MLNKFIRNNARFMFHGRAYNYFLILRKKVYISKCGSLAIKNLVDSWEGLYTFLGYKDGKGTQEQDEGG
jgi:hypothetical protein